MEQPVMCTSRNQQKLNLNYTKQSLHCHYTKHNFQVALPSPPPNKPPPQADLCNAGHHDHQHQPTHMFDAIPRPWLAWCPGVIAILQLPKLPLLHDLLHCPCAANELRVVCVDILVLTFHQLPDHALCRIRTSLQEVERTRDKTGLCKKP